MLGCRLPTKSTWLTLSEYGDNDLSILTVQKRNPIQNSNLHALGCDVVFFRDSYQASWCSIRWRNKFHRGVRLLTCCQGLPICNAHITPAIIEMSHSNSNYCLRARYVHMVRTCRLSSNYSTLSCHGLVAWHHAWPILRDKTHKAFDMVDLAIPPRRM